MADPVAVKRALARLASDADADRAVIEQADAAVDDLDAAVRFVADVGVARLAVAVERQRTAGNTDAVARGERTLEAFQRYRQAAGTTTQAPARQTNQSNQSNQSSEPSHLRRSSEPSHSRQSSATPPVSGDVGAPATEAATTGAAAAAGSTSNGDVGGRFDGSPFEHGLESLGVGLHPVDGNGGSEPAGRSHGEQGAGAADDASASEWVTLDGDQFHSHSGYGNGLGAASEDGRR